MEQVTAAEVGEFLKCFKKVASESGVYVVPREKNNAALVELGLTKQNRADIINGLAVEDYSSGPEPDSDKPGEVWFFGPAFNDGQIYIKLKLVVKQGVVPHALCISFHLARYPLALPHRREGK